MQAYNAIYQANNDYKGDNSNRIPTYVRESTEQSVVFLDRLIHEGLHGKTWAVFLL